MLSIRTGWKAAALTWPLFVLVLVLFPVVAVHGMGGALTHGHPESLSESGGASPPGAPCAVWPRVAVGWRIPQYGGERQRRGEQQEPHLRGGCALIGRGACRVVTGVVLAHEVRRDGRRDGIGLRRLLPDLRVGRGRLARQLRRTGRMPGRAQQVRDSDGRQQHQPQRLPVNDRRHRPTHATGTTKNDCMVTVRSGE